MGVDAAIFAANAKRYFYFDRRRNLMPCLCGGDLSPTLRAILETLYEHDPDALVPAKSLLLFLKHAEACDPNGWRPLIRQFVEAHPDDLFFVLHDHDADERHWSFYAESNGFEEWRPTSVEEPY